MHLRLGCVALKVPEQRQQQAQVVEHGWPQVERQRAHARRQIGDDCLGIAQPRNQRAIRIIATIGNPAPSSAAGGWRRCHPASRR